MYSLYIIRKLYRMQFPFTPSLSHWLVSFLFLFICSFLSFPFKRWQDNVFINYYIFSFASQDLYLHSLLHYFLYQHLFLELFHSSVDMRYISVPSALCYQIMLQTLFLLLVALEVVSCIINCFFLWRNK